MTSKSRQMVNRSSTNRDGSGNDLPEEIPTGYSIQREIGRGSFATVYSGTNLSTNRRVAIKAVIKSKLTNKLFQNLQDEINILKKIRHENVVGLLDCIRTNQYIFLIMQYCEDGDLSVYIKTRSKQPSSQSLDQGRSGVDRFPHPRDGGLNEWIVRSFLGQLADALQFLRSHSIIHRDIKPQNLLLHPSFNSSANPLDQNSSSEPRSNAFNQSDQKNQIKSLVAGRLRYVPEGIPILRVADFGFARVLTPSAGLAETLCGSPLYMAPEILRYEKYDAKADLWSVGAVLFEMSVGKPPFRAQNHVELLRKIEKSEDRIVFPNDKFVAEDIKNLIKCLLKQNPSERISFKEFFELADQVSSHGLLANPPAVNDSSSKPTQTLRNRLISNLAPRPPSLSTLPNPISPKQKTNPPPISPNRFEGEQGAFLVGNKTPSTINRSNSLKLINQPLTPDNSNTNKHNLNNPGQQAPSPSNLPNPLPPANYRPTNVLSFPAKYVTVGAGKQITITSSNQVPSVSTEIKTKDYALVPANQSKNNRMYADSNTTLNKTEGEDRDLGTEYVVVEKGSVEINALVDALSSSPRQAMSLGRRMSRGFMSSKPNLTSLNLSPHLNSSSSPPPPSSLITTTGYQPYASPNSSFPPRVHTLPSPPASTGAHPMMITNFGRSSPSTTALHNNYSSSPRSFDSNGGGGIGSLPIVGKYFPQSNQAQSPGSNRATFNQSSKSRPSFSFPSNRLSLAILRKQNQNPSTTAGSSHQLDRVENQLIEEFESLGCKILVICEYADEKLSKLLPPLPSSTSTSSRPTIESNSHNSFIGAFVSATPSGTQNQLNSQDRLCGELGSGVVEMNSNNEGDDQNLLAHEAMVLYLCVLKFLDRAIRHGVQVLDWKKSTSSNFNSSSNNNNLVNGRLGFSPEVGIGLPILLLHFPPLKCLKQKKTR
ncbi:ULK/ULK protein kinase [Phakopsora pachyrhizi]|uniref:non-specific serine/threonine protein kinase n=1 Tax=Phakopsora pachyrhizi TaxID=170000 RepID=A0AAV0BPX9_PHAPC|nr:ULK/ULK protein kinase [Phakopsora pachyrhizi]